MKYTIPSLYYLSEGDHEDSNPTVICSRETITSLNLRKFMLHMLYEIEKWDYKIEDIIIHPKNKQILLDTLPIEIGEYGKMFLWGGRVLCNEEVGSNDVLIVAEVNEDDDLKPMNVCLGQVDFELLERVQKLAIFV